MLRIAVKPPIRANTNSTFQHTIVVVFHSGRDLFAQLNEYFVITTFFDKKGYVREKSSIDSAHPIAHDQIRGDHDQAYFHFNLKTPTCDGEYYLRFSLQHLHRSSSSHDGDGDDDKAFICDEVLDSEVIVVSEGDESYYQLGKITA